MACRKPDGWVWFSLYHEEGNRFLGLRYLLPFDLRKWGKGLVLHNAPIVIDVPLITCGSVLP